MTVDFVLDSQPFTAININPQRVHNLAFSDDVAIVADDSQFVAAESQAGSSASFTITTVGDLRYAVVSSCAEIACRLTGTLLPMPGSGHVHFHGAVRYFALLNRRAFPVPSCQ